MCILSKKYNRFLLSLGTSPIRFLQNLLIYEWNTYKFILTQLTFSFSELISEILFEKKEGNENGVNVTCL